MVNQKKKNRFYITIAAIAGLAGILFGFDTGVISGAILFISKEFHLSPALNGVVVSSVLFGALVGAILSGRFNDIFGRKRLLITDGIIFIIGTVISAVSMSVGILIMGRIIVGIAIGIASYTAPLYISEISPKKYRGALVSLNQLAITVGILLSYIVDYYFAIAEAWRWMFMMGVIPALGLVIGMTFLPYSPRWIIFKGEPSRALKILKRIRNPDDDIEAEYKEIKESLKTKKKNWRVLFSKRVRGALIIGGGLAFLQQVVGVNTILYYAPTIFSFSGFPEAQTSILATMGIGVVFVIFTIVSLPFIDRLGRRPLLFIGMIGMIISLGALSWAFTRDLHSPELRWISFGSMILFIASFAISLGPIMWLMIVEVFPLEARGVGSSLATCINWASNMFVALTFLTLVKSIGASGTFFIYFLLGILGLLFIYFFIPETKGCSLERIEKNLYAGKRLRDLGEKHVSRD